LNACVEEYPKRAIFSRKCPAFPQKNQESGNNEKPNEKGRSAFLINIGRKVGNNFLYRRPINRTGFPDFLFIS
jgi:hypothetical protein